MPFPVQPLKVMLAPEVAMELTATAQEGLPVTVVTVTPPPPAVSVPVNAVPPEADAVYVKAIVELPEEFRLVLLGAAKLAEGPEVSTV